MAQLAEAQVRLINAQSVLVEIQGKDEEEIRAMKREALEREKRLDERIGKLVSAIGKLISRPNGQPEPES